MRKGCLKVLSLALCAAMLAIPAAAAETQPISAVPISAEVEIAPLAPLLKQGTISKEGDRLLLTNPENEQDITVLLTNEETVILNAVTGEPVALDKLEDGETVHAYVSPAMTLSLPPQTTAIVILAKIPDHYTAPGYYQVTNVELVTEEGISVSTDQGVRLNVSANATVTPYLTKNAVTFRDLVPGAKLVAWCGDGNAADAEKVMLFPYEGLPYTDVPEDHWAYDAITYVAGQGVMQSNAALAFNPDKALTRADMVTALYRMAGSPPVSQSAPNFSDVQAGAAYLDALTWAVGNELVGGYSDNTFRPDAPVSRQQLAVFLYRWEQHQGGGFKGMWMYLLDYTDRADIASYAYESVAWCAQQGVLTGRTDGTLAPNATVTRAAAATMIQRYMTLEKN